MRVTAIALACFLVTVAGQSAARSAELQTITVEQLAAFLKKDGRNPKIEQGQISYDMKGRWNEGVHGTVQLFKNQGFRLYLGFKMPSANPAKVNGINWQWPYCHAYFEDGAVYIIRDVYVPGITESNIIANTKMFDDVAAGILEELGG